MKRIFLVAGEASGDLHGSLLASALLTIDPSIEIVGVGGGAMEAAGVRLIQRSEEMAVTGLWEVLRHLPRMREILRRVEREVIAFDPDLLVPIDYPDFNMRLGKRVARTGIPIVYYISPQVWAWRRGRIRQLGRFVRRMIVIFPFEESLYKEAGVPVSYVGHPFVDRVRSMRGRNEERATLGIEPQAPLVLLLPGSRSSEIGRILPVLLETARTVKRKRPEIQWIIGLAPGLDRESIDRLCPSDSGIAIRAGETYELMEAADLIVTASGTATLEAALLGAPMIVIYKMHPLTWQLARRLVRTDHIAMANLLAERRLVPEFLQGEASPQRLAEEVISWIDDPQRRLRTGAALRAVASQLGEGGAAERAARILIEEIDS